MDGVLPLDKPAGMTSHDVVARVRRLLRTRRVGHAGTLDPEAVGVLVVAVGQATRLLPYLPTEPKVYVARIVFGAATDTEDAGGTVTAEADASSLTEAAVQAVLPRFLGTIEQVPPMVSALHHEGKRLYALARAGITVERAPRRVTVHALSLRDFTPGPRAAATLLVTCGGGTYIRTLCKDTGAALGLPAHLGALVRTAVGPFRREEAVPLESVSAARLLPMERALDLPTIPVTDEDAERLRQGMPVAATPERPLPEGGLAAALYRERLRALVRLESGWLRPFKVFS